MSEVTVKKVDGITRESTQAMIDQTLQAYPEKARGKRRRTWRPMTTATSACVNQTARPCRGS